MKTSAIFTVTFVLCLFAASVASGLTQPYEVGEFSGVLYAPDWIWQGQRVNVIATVRNNSQDATAVRFTISPVGDAANVVPPGWNASADIRIGGGEESRVLVGGFTVTNSAELREYRFSVEISKDESRRAVTYRLNVVRGSLVQAGIWSILLPVAIALLWSAVLLAVLPRFSKRGAWKMPADPFTGKFDEKEWFADERGE